MFDYLRLAFCAGIRAPSSCKAISYRMALVGRGISKEMIVDAPNLMYSSCMPQNKVALGYKLMDETRMGYAVFKALPDGGRISELGMQYHIIRPGGYIAYKKPEGAWCIPPPLAEYVWHFSFVEHV